MIEIPEVKTPPGGDHVAFVDAEPDRLGHRQPNGDASQDQPEQHPAGQWPGNFNRSQAAITVCCCSPRPSTPSRMVCPTLRKIGFGFLPNPTPGGVPVAMMSPACRVMK